MSLYPIKCKPRFKHRNQGTSLISTVLKKGAKGSYSECWDISGLQKDLSVVANGFLAGNNLEELTEIYLGDMVGDSVYERFGVEFPLMVKWIHTAQNGPVQVHPGDEMAMERHGCYGNHKWWYVLHAEPGAFIRLGLKSGLTERQFLDCIQHQNLESALNQQTVVPGDCFSVPAGTLHAAGEGILLLEVGQTSDVVYEVYHPDDIPLVLEATHRVPSGNLRVLCEDLPEWNAQSAFAVRRISVSHRILREYNDVDSFVLYVCVAGESRISGDGFESLDIRMGETILIPACLKSIVLRPYSPTVLFEIFIK